MSNAVSGNLERLIKRSAVIENRLTGNIFCTVAIDQNENVIGCGCAKLYNLAPKGYVALSADTLTIMAVTNSGSLAYKSLTPFEYDLMPYYAFEGVNSITAYDTKSTQYCGMVAATLRLSGRVEVGGYCEAGEDEASQWTDIDELVLFDEGVLGVTKNGRVKLCGAGAQPYREMTAWTDIARVKKLSAGIGCLSFDGFVGLKKDGTLLYCGGDREFSEYLSSFTNVVSFDGYCSDGKVEAFDAVMSDGGMRSYFPKNELMPTVIKDHYKKDFIAVKYLPSGTYFIKQDGSIETLPKTFVYPEEIKDALITLTGQKYDAVYTAITASEQHPLSEQVKGWKLFRDPDEVLRRYEGYETGAFKLNKKCLYCGGDLKGFFGKTCTVCGKKASF